MKNNKFNTVSSPASLLPTINPWFLVGFTDGDGSFTYKISKRVNFFMGYQVALSFQIEILNTPENRLLLGYFQGLFNGNITISGRTVVFHVSKIEDQVQVKEFFDKYNQRTTKMNNFNTWSRILEKILNKEHQSEKGFEEIIALTGQFPKGISARFAHLASKPVVARVSDAYPLDPNWIAGFVAADGSFSSIVQPNKKSKVGFYVKSKFTVTQHTKDLNVLRLIQDRQGGSLYPRKSQEAYDLQITKQVTFLNLIDFFNEYPIYGTKYLDFKDWSLIIGMIQHREHQTKEGIEKIVAITAGMNSYRY